MIVPGDYVAICLLIIKLRQEIMNDIEVMRMRRIGQTGCRKVVECKPVKVSLRGHTNG
jgi:hypothetical protein